MNPITGFLSLINGYKTYTSVVVSVCFAFAMIQTEKLGHGLSDLCQACALLFAGATAVGLRHAVAKGNLNSDI